MTEKGQITLEEAAIIKYLKKKRYKIDLTEKVTMTLEEANRIIDNTMMNGREIYKRHNIDVQSAINDEPKLRELMLKHLKQFYEIKE